MKSRCPLSRPFLEPLFVLFAIAVVLHATHGQTPSPAGEPFTEMGKPDCEMLWAQLDLASSETLKVAGSRLVIDITGFVQDSPERNVYWYEFVRSYFARRKIEPDRWTIRTLPLADQWTIKFWILPAGSDPPQVIERKWRLKYPSGTKPFMFTNGDSYSVEVGVCLYVDEVAMLADAVKENPSSRVNVVLTVKSDREFIRRKRKVLKELDEYSVSPDKVRVFKKISRKPNPYGIDPTIEYWLLP